MKRMHVLISKNESNHQCSSISIDPVHKCPICHQGMSPIVLTTALSVDENNLTCASIIFQCTVCGKTFLAKYIYARNGATYSVPPLYDVSPSLPMSRSFDDSISEISPSFKTIYNQAENAEQSLLSELTGMGYRKALEFLVKDYAILNYPNDRDEIVKKKLGDCINDYIDDEKIKLLAKKAAWLGNDESHYLRLRDGNIENIKTFIDAIVYYIASEAAVKKADTIEANVKD